MGQERESEIPRAAPFPQGRLLSDFRRVDQTILMRFW